MAFRMLVIHFEIILVLFFGFLVICGLTCSYLYDCLCESVPSFIIRSSNTGLKYKSMMNEPVKPQLVWKHANTHIHTQREREIYISILIAH